MKALANGAAAVQALGEGETVVDVFTYSATDGSGQPDGRPNAEGMVQMWAIVYAYMKLTGSDGLSPRRPTPPELITDHSFPTPPGGASSSGSRRAAWRSTGASPGTVARWCACVLGSAGC